MLHHMFVDIPKKNEVSNKKKKKISIFSNEAMLFFQM